MELEVAGQAFGTLVGFALVVGLVLRRVSWQRGRRSFDDSFLPGWFDGRHGLRLARRSSLSFLAWGAFPMLPLLFLHGGRMPAPSPWGLGIELVLWGTLVLAVGVLAVVGRRRANQDLEPLGAGDPLGLQREHASHQLVTWVQTQGLLTSVPLAGFTLIAFFLPDALFWAVYGGVLTAGTAFAASWPGRARRGAIVGILESGGARFDISAALAEYDVDDNDEPDWF